jgi:nitroreductase
MPLLDLSPDRLLTTTRSVRKRLDLARPVEPEVIRACLELAVQAPTASNSQNWHFVIVTDHKRRQALGEIYRKGYALYRQRVASGQPVLVRSAMVKPWWQLRLKSLHICLNTRFLRLWKKLPRFSNMVRWGIR